MSRVHVAVGVILNPRGEILISKRHSDSHQGGLWEFPGGKVEAGEAVEVALHRELREELGVEILNWRALLEVRHDYPDKKVLLDVWLIENFSGEPIGREGQPLHWCAPEALLDFQFPAANKAIVEACLVLADRLS
jgi:8-oxo-dGTP diphosphatase